MLRIWDYVIIYIMVQISSPQVPPELSQPSMTQAIRFFTPIQRKILIIASVTFGILLISGAVYFYFWLTAFKKSQVDFSITGPTQVQSGSPSVFTISFWNNTNQILQSAVLTIRYPKDAVAGDINSNPKIIGTDTILENIELGDIGIGGGSKRDVMVSLIGFDKSIQKIGATLLYKPQNTSSKFENNASIDIAINGSAMSVDFRGPESVLFGDKGMYEIRYKNISDKVFRNARVAMTYPNQFSFVAADPIPTGSSNNTWDLGDLNPGEEGDIKLQGILRDSGQVANFTAFAGVMVNSQFIKFTELNSQVSLTPAPLQVDITVNGQTSIFANTNDLLDFAVHYKNDSSIPLSSLVLKVRLDGTMYDFTTLKTDGFFSSLNNTITFNSANTPGFANLTPGDDGSVTFQVKVRSRYLVRTFRDKNFTLSVAASLETPTVPPPIVAKTLLVSADLSVKVNTQATIQTKGYYFDEAIKNSGLLPPRVNQATTYTIHWLITNFSSDLDNVVVKATLPQGVSWTGKTGGAGGPALDFNATTGIVTWNAGKIQAATGVLLSPLEAIFQVSLTPSVDQVGSTVPVINETALTAKDLFTGNDITAQTPILRTDMPDDSGVGLPKSKIQQ
ncbi:hypothetical protein A2833_02765 [Candidatus Azambacteria bacterium RIFCSPHIGHO2_01_FULL_44_55]|uniref:DUF11 domain-containing protein n=1 Tax=Candidatus Azambacteria bacterium RIFCSPLOWO2_02_FULL_44_14 TaxID=1797306 RepID=A0A1F5CAA9_9BACT|nr:MAG: hypothetical protein A3A18_01700 [Candidatus Azambacteria bacterium RIFCSPLOWO2_01_FULL_44_84]OGD32821.1 MAG: hypothetical protein A3C78_03415 [Candidatus Azambacteria bacterium RIFCSPHIGHO2_02_FULL_45_18]OGD39787.1 MAG: hypothetical protein A3I30_02180 [Candidatus Azambacteria bacterium RIFCSPLOWO2_02_FULL_44_14]OGD40480.1 MAG: hypothetical protein A2833_02765 [Candidatus Azambacteria bacterium RIFCSPHIGHO2_01_FULL_44_55]OGD52105.1 MAG: hypothetical protein A2608_00355 [Candidatus Azam